MCCWRTKITPQRAYCNEGTLFICPFYMEVSRLIINLFTKWKFGCSMTHECFGSCCLATVLWLIHTVWYLININRKKVLHGLFSFISRDYLQSSYRDTPETLNLLTSHISHFIIPNNNNNMVSCEHLNSSTMETTKNPRGIYVFTSKNYLRKSVLIRLPCSHAWTI